MLILSDTEGRDLSSDSSIKSSRTITYTRVLQTGYGKMESKDNFILVQKFLKPIYKRHLPKVQKLHIMEKAMHTFLNFF